MLIVLLLLPAGRAHTGETAPASDSTRPPLGVDEIQVRADGFEGPVKSVRAERGADERQLVEEAEYDADGWLVRRTLYDKSGALLAAWTCTRNEAGRVVEATKRNAQGTVEARWTCTWDESGRLTERDRSDANGQPLQRIVTRYGADAQPVEVSVYNTNGALVLREIRSTTDPNNSIVARFRRGETTFSLEYMSLTDATTGRTEWARYDRDGELEAAGVYRTDEHGCVLSWIEKSPDGTTTKSWTATYESDEHGNWTTMSRSGSGVEPEVVHRSITYFNNDGSVQGAVNDGGQL